MLNIISSRTQKQTLFLLIALVIAICSLPLSASAYVTTGNNAFTIDGHTGIYTIDFTFGHQNHDVSIPLYAVRSPYQSDAMISYELLNKEDDSCKNSDFQCSLSIGNAIAIVLSDTQIRDEMYFIPKGTRASFTLLVVFESPRALGTLSSYLHVTHLPFLFDGKQKLRLNPSELQYYMTSAVKHLSQ